LNPRDHRASLSIQWAVLALVAITMLAAMLPAGLLMDRWLGRELAERARRDLAVAPAMLEDRNRTVGDALMMHAKDVAHAAPLVESMRSGDLSLAVRAADDAARSFKHGPVLVAAGGEQLAGPSVPASLLDETRVGRMPVAVTSDSTGLHLISVVLAETRRSRRGCSRRRGDREGGYTDSGRHGPNSL
jgi:hypothetical protein